MAPGVGAEAQPEECNGLGDACDEDSDGDGDLNDTDCAPLDPLVHTGALENCLTEYDDNCNGVTNEENGVACSAYFLDEDGGGHHLRRGL